MRKYIEKERKERGEVVPFFLQFAKKNFCDKSEERERRKNKENKEKKLFLFLASFLNSKKKTRDSNILIGSI